MFKGKTYSYHPTLICFGLLWDADVFFGGLQFLRHEASLGSICLGGVCFTLSFGPKFVGSRDQKRGHLWILWYYWCILKSEKLR